MDQEAKWKAFVQRNRTYLVQNVDFKNTELWDAVQSQGIVSRLQVDSITSNNNANFRQVGAFVDHLLKRTKFDYDKFIEALKQTGQQHIADFLNAGGESPVLPSPAPIPEYVAPMPGIYSYGQHPYQQSRPHQGQNVDLRNRGDAQAFSSPSSRRQVFDVPCAPPPAPAKDIRDIKKKIRDLQLPIPYKKCTKKFKEEKEATERCYKMEHTVRGRALMVTMTGDREGWEADVMKVATLLKYLDIDVQYEFDVVYDELVRSLEKFALSDENSYVDCVWVVIMGHGGKMNGEDYLATRDGKTFFIRREMEVAFDNNKCLSLREKPKVILVQMCRGDQDVHGVDDDRRTQADARPPPKLAPFQDYLISYATQPGKKAMRNTVDGSWYIQKLTEVFMKRADCVAVPDMLEEVNREVRQQITQDKEGKFLVQTAEATSSLNYRFYLFPRVYEDVEKPMDSS